MSGELNARKETILRAVVFEYVGGAEPVGSEMLMQKYELGVKSATIRNELAEMSELGFLEQPHTSAGRIPSDLGYRYYVDKLISTEDPNQASRAALSSALAQSDVLHMLLQDTTRTLCKLTRLLTAATIVRDSNVVIKTSVVSALGPHQALLVLVLSNGHVQNRMIECPAGLTLDQVGEANQLLAQTTTGKSLRIVVKNKAPAANSAQSEKFVGAIWTGIRAIARELTRVSITTQGEEYLVGQPEFQKDTHAIGDLLDALKDSDAFYEALSSGSKQTSTVTIGRENAHEGMRSLSVVRQAFFAGETEVGTIAVIGPTRMNYDQSIPLVDYAAKALSDSLTRFFG